MPHPVIHAEIRSGDPDATRAFFADLFGWTYADGGLPGYTFADTGSGTRCRPRSARCKAARRPSCSSSRCRTSRRRSSAPKSSAARPSKPRQRCPA